MKKSSSLIILASTTVMVLTLIMMVNYIRAGNYTSLNPKASDVYRQVSGGGKTAHLNFNVNVMETGPRLRGTIAFATLSPQDEISKVVVKPDSVLWSHNTAFAQGDARIVYQDRTKSGDYRAKILMVDQDYLDPDPNPYYDVFSVQICLDGNCSTPWMPWTVVEGDLVVE